jgi:hypothetical protein
LRFAGGLISQISKRLVTPSSDNHVGQFTCVIHC